MADTTDNKQLARPRNRKYMLVRHGRMHHIGLFEHNESEIPKTPTKVVVKSDKGLELGEIVGHLTCYKGGRFRMDGDQVDEYFKTSDIDISCKKAGKFIRYASDDDLSEQHHFQKILKGEIATCERIAEELKLPMKVVEAEHILGGERIVFYFMAEGRIDFRELVRRLSHEFQTRIEMRQIGARDEAKLLGDVESCGQEICCRRYLKYLKPVNMRMAKMQKATLDPAKISGYCGRLKCCLRYEDETYGDLKKKLPRKNVMVRTPKGEGRVVETQIITQLVMVEYDRNEREAVAVEDIQVLGPAPRRPRPEEDETPEKAEKGGDRRRPDRSQDRNGPKPDEASSDTEDAPERQTQEQRPATNDRPEGQGDNKKRRRRRGRGPGRKHPRGSSEAGGAPKNAASDTPEAASGSSSAEAPAEPKPAPQPENQAE
jgi:cell fate regulator YaaT (PSP1 superfamily)